MRVNFLQFSFYNFQQISIDYFSLSVRFNKTLVVAISNITCLRGDFFLEKKLLRSSECVQIPSRSFINPLIYVFDIVYHLIYGFKFCFAHFYYLVRKKTKSLSHIHICMDEWSFLIAKRIQKLNSILRRN